MGFRNTVKIRLSLQAIRLVGLFICLFPLTGKAEKFFEDHARGWHWYEHQAVSQAKKPLKKRDQPPVKPPKVDLKDPTQLLASYRKLIKRSFDQALVNPTPQNLYAYMALQKDSMERSHRFATTWQKVVLLNPELDDTLKYPVSQTGRHIAYSQEKKQVAHQIKALKETHGLYFFFKAHCPYCHAQAPIVKAFAEKYGWEVFAISLDGSQLPEFPNSKLDNGMAVKLGVTMAPALFIASPSQGKILPLSHGLISEKDFEDRIHLLTLGGRE